MTDDGGLGSECRRLRERAGVSIHQLARDLHRDPSSLSRFERGQQVPRDVANVVTAYRALEPIQRTETQHGAPPLDRSSLRRPVIHAILGRWVLLPLVLLMDDLVILPNPHDPDVVRVFIASGAVIGIPLTVQRVRCLGPGADPAHRLLWISWGLAAAFLALSCLSLLGAPKLHVTAFLAISIIETGLFALAWPVPAPISA